MSNRINKALSYIFIALGLCGCATNSRKQPQSQLMTISNDRSDIIIVPRAVCYNEKFRVRPLEYSALIASDPIGIGGYRESKEEGFFSQATSKSSHQKWLSKMRAHAIEMDIQINGAKPSNMMDIRNIPIGISYKLELDKPRKKAKNGNGAR